MFHSPIMIVGSVRYQAGVYKPALEKRACDILIVFLSINLFLVVGLSSSSYEEFFRVCVCVFCFTAR